ncbi:MAG TPA: YopT-type cysteine protease domain-containing protein [Bryobacteraceae bacterium]|jgi:hypothetical protein
MLLRLIPNASLGPLPDQVWVKISADAAVHKTPKSTLFWDRGSLKSRRLGQITEVHDSDPRIGAGRAGHLPPVDLGPLPDLPLGLEELPPPTDFPPAPNPTDLQVVAQQHNVIRTRCYDQGRDPALLAHADTNEGACIFLSLQWLADWRQHGDSDHFWSNRLESGASGLTEETAQAALNHMSGELAAGEGPAVRDFRRAASQSMGLTWGGAPGQSHVSDYGPERNEIFLRPNAPFNDLPAHVWVQIKADRKVHKIPKTTLLWNNGVLKTRTLGEITCIMRSNPTQWEEAMFGYGVLDRVRATGRALHLVALRPRSEDGGGHAMAIVKEDDAYTIFDPNGGEASFGTYLDAENFFQAYWHYGRAPYSRVYDAFQLYRFS